MERENDFSQGSIAKNILNLAVPMTLAQLINVLYSVVDRVYIRTLTGRICECTDEKWSGTSDYYNHHGIC